jgi:hypothetical protein
MHTMFKQSIEREREHFSLSLSLSLYIYIYILGKWDLPEYASHCWVSCTSSR